MICARARRGAREDARLYVIAVSSLTVAFLCLGTALLGLSNLAELASRWGRTHRISVYLHENAPEPEVHRLTSALAALPSVERAEYTSAELARAQFLRGAPVTSSLRALPSAAFPASIEVTFKPQASAQQIDEVARKVAAHRAVVEDVDTYGAWFAHVAALAGAGRAVALGLVLLVTLCVMAVIANTIRLAVANRRKEIEVLKMCGATDAFVRAPFVLEGTLQGLCGALLALLILVFAYLGLRSEVDATLRTFAGMQLVFLPPAMTLGLVLGGATVGAIGSALSVRRYIAV